MNTTEGVNMKTGLCLFALLILSGCANPNLVVVQGEKLNASYSLQDRRAAKSHITVPANLPIGVEIVGTGPFTVERCPKSAQHAAPSESVLLDDLVLLAYTKGADGLTDIKYEEKSGIIQKCGHVAKASAIFYRNKK